MEITFWVYENTEEPRGAPELSAVQHGYGSPGWYSSVASQSWSSLTVWAHFFYVKAQIYPQVETLWSAQHLAGRSPQEVWTVHYS